MLCVSWLGALELIDVDDVNEEDENDEDDDEDDDDDGYDVEYFDNLLDNSSTTDDSNDSDMDN